MHTRIVNISAFMSTDFAGRKFISRLSVSSYPVFLASPRSFIQFLIVYKRGSESELKHHFFMLKRKKENKRNSRDVEQKFSHSDIYYL